MRQILLVAGFVGFTAATTQAEEWDWKEDRRVAEANGWIWTGADVKEGFQQAKRTGKPLMVVLRCPP